MKKRLFAALLCALMLATLFPIVLPASAAVEGDWTTYRFASEYCDESCDCDGEEHYFRPEAGYKYTDEGFTVIPADYRETTPQLSVVSKEAKPVKEGIYLQFRVDDFSYGNGTGADEWITLTLTTEGKVEPGSTDFGGGWMVLIRGDGDGEAQFLPHLTDPKTEGVGGSFKLLYDGHVDTAWERFSVPRDNRGREIYTLEVTWDGSAYEMKLNGQTLYGSAETTALLEKLNPEGEFFVGINMWSGVRDGTAALTVLQYGACEADATTPVGDDSKEPEKNVIYIPEPADPSTVPDGMPAILWSPATVNIKSGYNCGFSVLGDNTWRVEATEADLFFNFTPKRQWSYDAKDFPVFGILLRDFWVDTGTMWYSAGEYMTPTSGCTVPFSVYDGEFYGMDDEYVFIPVDLTDLWEGRINAIRIDVYIADEGFRDFDICFAGMFRSVSEAYAYAEEWLDYDTPLPDTPPPTEPPTEPPYDPAPETDAPGFDTIPEEVITEEIITEVISEVESILDTEEDEATDPEQAAEDVLAKYGCTGSLGAVTLLAAAAATLVLFKRKE